MTEWNIAYEIKYNMFISKMQKYSNFEELQDNHPIFRAQYENKLSAFSN